MTIFTQVRASGHMGIRNVIFSVMRVKKAVEKFRSHFESKEYEYLLGLIIGQDQSVFAAY